MLLKNATLWIAGGATLVLAAAPPLPKTSKNGAKTAPPSVGEKVFREQCASCHGAKGEGGPGYARPLAGTLSVGQLGNYIARSMPPGPKHASPSDAKKVAGWMHDAFYSPLAQERNRPARVALSRLTVRQYKNAVADLAASFREAKPLGKAEGLWGEYFKANDFQKKELAIERTDRQVAFDFGTGGPQGAEFNPHQFSARWTGSLIAPDTGVYEITVRSDHAVRLWLNDDETPVLDKWVKSGKETDHRAQVYLIGGRAYPLRLEFSKSTQGVDDSEQKKGKPAPPAFVALAWKRPKLAEETIPARYLRSEGTPESLVIASNFPPDDRSMGYERGDSVSRAWDDATTAAALEAADWVVAHLNDLAGSRDDSTKLRAFSRVWVERALRRPLDAQTEELYVTRQFERAPDPVTAVKRVVLLSLKSPRFLYREIGGTGDAYDTASRLSFALWDSLPDAALLQAAQSGNLKTRAQIEAQAQRLASDPRAWYKQREFFLHWLKVDTVPDLAKDKKRFPAFTPTVATDLRESLDRTLESVVRSPNADYRELMQTPRVFLNGRLAPLYGAKVAPNADFQPVSLDPTARAGILTHPYLLASFSYLGTSSPIHRGVLLTRSVMGRTLAAPPAAFVPLSADLHPSLTTRQRVALQTKPAACISCHQTINNLGFALESFDAIGRVRAKENNRPVDATGSYETRSGAVVKFAGAKDLARFVAGSEEAHAAFVEKFFQAMTKQPVRAYGPQTLPNLERDFKNGRYNMRQLAVRIAVTSALPRGK